MDELSAVDSPALFLFLFLLPGFLGLLVYGFLVQGEPQDKFDRLVTAFALSLVASLIVSYLVGYPIVPGPAVTATTSFSVILKTMIGRSLLDTSIVAVLIAGSLAWLNNHGKIYNILNYLKISYKTSNSDVWQDVFYRHRAFWLQLEFRDGRKLVGWPKYFSATGKARELFLADATWYLTDESGVESTLDVDGPGIYIVDMTLVTGIEILK